MRLEWKVLLAALVVLLPIVFARQAGAQMNPPRHSFGTGPGQTPLVEVNVGYAYMHVNAPPGQCGCFSLNGGVASAIYNLPHGIGVVGDFTGAHAGNAGGTTQNVTLYHYLFGPRYSLRPATSRFTPYGEILGGGAKETSNYAAVKSVNGGAFLLGGGVEERVSRRIGWNVVEVDWLHSYLNNGGNGRQNDLRVTTALTLRFGPR